MRIGRQDKRFRTMFERLRDPLIVVSPDGEVIEANAVAQAVLDVDGDHLRDVTSLESSFVFDGDKIATLAARARPVFGYRPVDEEGNASDVVIDIIDLDERRGQVTTKLIHIKDFSAQKRYERWKDELISMVAHEIKNPLAAMKNSMSILLSEACPADPQAQGKLITTSVRSINRLTRLLDGFLDISRIESGHYTLEPTWINAHEFIPDVIDSFGTLFNVDPRTLEFDVSEEIEEVFVDAGKLEQILINLLSNAVKFTSSGGQIAVTVTAAGLEALSDDYRILPWHDIGAPSFFAVAVRDTGIGMTGDTLAHLFTRYYREADDRKLGRGPLYGSHLGLNISKTLTEVQNGTLHIDSEPGVGTDVIVYLPKDEKTSEVLARLRSFERCLGKALAAHRNAGVYALRKYESKHWNDVAEKWEQGVLINPTRETETQTGAFLWTLGTDLALLLVLEDEQPPALSMLTGVVSSDVRWGTSSDGYMVGRCQAPEDGTRMNQLINLAVKRMKQAPPVVTRT